MEERNRAFTDEELDMILPTQGYEVIYCCARLREIFR